MTRMSDTAQALGNKPKKLARILTKTKLRLPLDHMDVAVVLHYARYGEMPVLVEDEGTEGLPVEYLRDPSKLMGHQSFDNIASCYSEVSDVNTASVCRW